VEGEGEEVGNGGRGEGWAVGVYCYQIQQIMKMYMNTIKTRDPSHPRQCSRQGLFKDGEKTMGVGIHYCVYVFCILFSCFVFVFEAENHFVHPKFVVVQPQP